MSMRNGLLGLAGVCAVAGAAAGAPSDPHVDGRVADPVAQDYYQPEVIVAGFRAVPVRPARSIPEAVGRTAAGAATAAPVGGMGHAVGASLSAGRPGSGRGSHVADVAGGVPGAILDSTTVPLGTVPIDD
jgi:hypothetical protein